MFRVAAAAYSFRRAAERLAVTQSAVSQRVQRLEARLGVELFARSGRSLRLTATGRLLFERTADGFDGIAEGLAALPGAEGAQQLKVSCVPSLALEWLTPRLPRFLLAEPSTTVAIYGEVHDLDRARFVAEAIDVAIRYGPGEATSLHLACSREETVFPVASPAYLERRSEPITLLHDAIPWERAAATTEWDLWLAERDPPWPGSRRDLFFNLAQLAYRAAIEGSGVAMGRSLIVGRHLAEGRLVSATDQAPVIAAAYRVLTLTPPTEGSAVDRFVRWLAGELGSA